MQPLEGVSKGGPYKAADDQVAAGRRIIRVADVNAEVFALGEIVQQQAQGPAFGQVVCKSPLGLELADVARAHIDQDAGVTQNTRAIHIQFGKKMCCMLFQPAAFAIIA